jgi:hypothetical protein
MIVTAEEHLAMADLIRSVAGKPGGPTVERADQMARNREVLAQLAAYRYPMPSPLLPADERSR